MAQLTQRPEIVACSPTLDDLAVSEAKDLDRRRLDCLAGGWHAHVSPSVRSRTCVAAHNFVSFGHHVFNLERKVREHRA